MQLYREQSVASPLWGPYYKVCAAITVPLIFLLVYSSASEIRSFAEGQFVHAASEGDITTMRLLLMLGVDVDVYPEGKVAPALILASSDGQNDAVSFLLEHGADVNVKEKWGCTSLIYATNGGHTETVRLLLASGADANVFCDGGSALHAALEQNHNEIAELLRQRGARDCRTFEPESCFPN